MYVGLLDEFVEMATRVAKRRGFRTRSAYLESVLRRAITRDARRLGLLSDQKRSRANETAPR